VHPSSLYLLENSIFILPHNQLKVNVPLVVFDVARHLVNHNYGHEKIVDLIQINGINFRYVVAYQFKTRDVGVVTRGHKEQFKDGY